MNACEKTLRIWLRQVKGNSNALKQELFSRTGIDPGSCDDINDLFATLWLHYSAEEPDCSVFEHFQTELCKKSPGIGIFRVLFSAAGINTRGSP